ncbi:MAG: Asp23/Gls24 family envelope stress response protein [Candidatus Cryosericum sp.]|nr:Asp23/Gls24 family envelope stress response protein [bacterium]
MTDPKGRVVLSKNAMEEILRLATLNVYGVTGLAPVTFAERFTHALTLLSSPKGVDVQLRNDGVIEATVHVRLQYGLRVSEVARTICSQVRYVFCSMTGLPEDRVELNVVVWSIRVEREGQ